MSNILPSFFKARKPRQFNYKPMYYNERKEQLDNRIEAIKREMTQKDADTPDSALRLRMRNEWQSKHHAPRRKSSLRIAVIFIILLALSYLLLRG